MTLTVFFRGEGRSVSIRDPHGIGTEEVLAAMQQKKLVKVRPRGHSILYIIDFGAVDMVSIDG